VKLERGVKSVCFHGWMLQRSCARDAVPAHTKAVLRQTTLNQKDKYKNY